MNSSKSDSVLKETVVFFLLIAVSFVFISLSIKLSGVMLVAKEFTFKVFYSLEHPVVEVVNAVEGLFTKLTEAEKSKREIEKLRKEVWLLRSELLRLGYKKEFKSPYKGLGFKICYASVIKRPAERWWEEIFINKGKLSGIKAGAAVVLGDGLIGQVKHVYDNYSVAVLVTAASSMIPAVVNETRDIGVLVVDGWGNVWLDYIPVDSKLKKGYKLFTPVIMKGLPSGIAIGYIDGKAIQRSGYLRYPVKLIADISKIVNVCVIWREKGF